MTSSRDGASRIIRLRCSGLGRVIWARSLTRRSVSISVQPCGCGAGAWLRTTWRECLSVTLKAVPKESTYRCVYRKPHPTVFAGENFLLLLKKSLFLEIFSLLICVGNCAKSRCSTAASC
jgi:hypothetical protein